MQRASSKKFLALCRKWPLPLFSFHEPSKSRHFSTYSHLGSAQNSVKSSSWKESGRVSSEAIKGHDLIRLSSEPESSMDSKRHDEFSADVEKIYRILRKFHTRAPKLELALKESGVVYVFGCLLDALCKNSSVKEAALLFDDMRMRFKPTIKHFTSLLYGWCREGKLMEAKHVLGKMKEAGFEPDIVVYNNLLNGYAVAGKMVDAFDLLQEMKRKGCEPNATSFTVVIQALCAQEKMDEAIRILSDMERSGCEADVVTYTTMISGFCKWGKINKGYELLDSMIQKGLTPTQTTYLHIMLAHEKKEELEECMQLVEEMQKIGLVPDVSIYNTLIRLSCKLGEIKECIRFWNQIEVNGISPGVDSFVIMINGLVEQGCLVEACNYFKDMILRGLLSAPQYGTLKDLLNSLLRADKVEMAKDVWSCIMTKGCELNTYAWTIWIHALFSKGHVKEACSYCLDMMDSGVMPQPDTFAKLMRGLRKLYNRQLAAEITEKVRKMAAERQMTFKMYKRRGERDLKEKAKAKKDGRKRRARRRQWGKAQNEASIYCSIKYPSASIEIRVHGIASYCSSMQQ
ncbi:unnamed protein product [Coffea canephora]|uniref:Pentacotripeptide-repeat region of PRORP domain-containing protein n=1 Tax=Coffea canephora TaxID=49390 RepID=A0A068TQ18_COFCA|nr:unnamed protein product [Coffea canephora]